MKKIVYKKYIKMSPTKLTKKISIFKKQDLLKIYLKLLKFKNSKFKKIILQIFHDIFSYIKTTNIYISEVFVNKDIVMKRSQPRAKGRAFKIEKKSSKICFILQVSENKTIFAQTFAINKIEYYSNFFNN